MLLIFIPLTFLSALILITSILKVANFKRFADSVYPYITPISSGNNSQMQPLLIIADCVLLYIVLIYEINLSPKLTFSRVFIKNINQTF